MSHAALVTGSSSGLGKEVALTLANQGFKVVVNGTSEEKLSYFEKFKNIYVWRCDLKNHTDIASSLRDFLAHYQIQIDYFVHSAGIDGMCPIRSLQHDSYEKLFAVNFFSAVEIVKTLASRKTNDAALKSAVLISSNASGFGARGMSMYVASKAALDSFMRTAAIEFAPRIRFNSVLPGAVRTDMTDKIFENEEIVAKLLSAYPMGAGKPSDVASLVIFLLSDAASWINGQQIVVDGGRSINISA